MTQQGSELLLTYSQDLFQSFSFNNDDRLKESTGSLLETYENEKPCNIFTEIAHQLTNLHITLPAGKRKVSFVTDCNKNLDEVKKWVEETTNIPIEKQRYLMDSRLLDDHAKLINQQVCDKDAEIKLELKQSFQIKLFHKICEIYTKFEENASKLIVNTISSKKKLQENDLLPIDRDILVQISAFKDYQQYFPSSIKISEIRKNLAGGWKCFYGGEHFDFYFGGVIVEEEKPLSDFYSEKSSVQFEFKPKPNHLYVELIERSHSDLPCLVFMPNTSCSQD